MQLDAGATNSEVKFKADEIFRAGQWTKERTLAREAAAQRTNLVANHRLPNGGKAGGAGDQVHATVDEVSTR